MRNEEAQALNAVKKKRYLTAKVAERKTRVSRGPGRAKAL